MPELIALSLALTAAYGAAVLFLAREHQAQRAEWTTERRDLLNRLMSADYREYRAGEAPRRNGVRVLRDADEKRISERAS